MSRIDAISRGFKVKFGTMTESIIDSLENKESIISGFKTFGFETAKDIGSVAGITAGSAVIGAAAGITGSAIAKDRNIRYGADATGIDDALVQGAWAGALAGLGVGLAWRGGRRAYQGISWMGKKVDKRAGEEFTSSIGG